MRSRAWEAGVVIAMEQRSSPSLARWTPQTLAKAPGLLRRGFSKTQGPYPVIIGLRSGATFVASGPRIMAWS